MKKVTLLLGALLFLYAVAVQADNATLTVDWIPVTTEADICTGTPVSLTAPITYTIEWKVKGGATATPIEVTAPPYVLGGLYYATTYQARVGGHKAGKPVSCWSEWGEGTTKASPPPTACPKPTLTP